ncbi:PaaI family thioesterase [Parafilimonas sp.]|uniref:PaaI family thioesterase n=1 Tax=Parafilimonas sp. TaxID=1969739 RepID=UPI0039E4519B
MHAVTPSSIVEYILRKDAFSQWLGIELLEIKEGYSKIKISVRQEMVNGLNVVHGGIAFSLADRPLHLPVTAAIIYHWLWKRPYRF